MRFVSIFILLLCSLFTKGQSLRINEFSQGLSGAGSGTQEWVELVVIPGASGPVGPNNCGVFTLDISNWILDDNNGLFAPANSYSGSGIASGHIRFKNVAPWNRLPVGAIILIYNVLDKDAAITAADDLTDANMDCVYIVPSNSTSLEYNLSVPNAPGGCNSVTSTYSGPYSTSPPWSTIGLANTGDAIQIRDASGNLVHAVVYGKNSGCTGSDLVGNALSPFIGNANMISQFAYYNGNTIAGYLNAANWVRGTYGVDAPTPGAYNNATNQTLIESLIRGGCTCEKILDLYLLNFFATKQGKEVKLDWQYQMGVRGIGSISVERSADGRSFVPIGIVDANEISFIDHQPLTRNFYRLKMVLDGSIVHYSRMVPLFFDRAESNIFTIAPNPFKDQIVLQKNDARAYDITLEISDIAGRRLHQQKIRMGSRDQMKWIPVSSLPKGMLIANIFYQNGASGNQHITQMKLLHQ
jgi:hypothetical protein